MNSRLNFYRFAFGLILAFVSFWVTASLATSTSGQETHEQKVERMKTDIRKDPQNIQQIVDLAETFYNKGDYEKTTLLLWKQIDKLDRKALILLAKAHQKRNEPSEMIRALNISLGKNEKDAEANTLMGDAYKMQKKSKEALEHYKTALEIDPKYEPAYRSLATHYEKNPYELRILYQDMIQNLGSRPEFIAKLCEINTQDGTFEDALKGCREAIAKDPKLADPYVNLAISLKATGADTEATKTLKKAADEFPKSEFAQYTYGRQLEDQKSYVEAMKYYKQGVDADPKASRSWLGLATTSFEVKKYDISLIAYKNACKYDKKTAVAFRKATTVLRTNRNSDWIGKFESASENCTF